MQIESFIVVFFVSDARYFHGILAVIKIPFQVWRWLYFVTVLCEIKIKHCVCFPKQDLQMSPSDSDL
jgi:hypothetical protein